RMVGRGPPRPSPGHGRRPAVPRPGAEAGLSVLRPGPGSALSLLGIRSAVGSPRREESLETGQRPRQLLATEPDPEVVALEPELGSGQDGDALRRPGARRTHRSAPR